MHRAEWGSCICILKRLCHHFSAGSPCCLGNVMAKNDKTLKTGSLEEWQQFCTNEKTFSGSIHLTHLRVHLTPFSQKPHGVEHLDAVNVKLLCHVHSQSESLTPVCSEITLIHVKSSTINLWVILGGNICFKNVPLCQKCIISQQFLVKRNTPYENILFWSFFGYNHLINSEHMWMQNNILLDGDW